MPTDSDGFEDEYSEGLGFTATATDNGWGQSMSASGGKDKGPTAATGKEIKVSSSLPPPALKSHDSKLEKLQQEVSRLREENTLLRVAATSAAPSSSILGNPPYYITTPDDTAHPPSTHELLFCLHVLHVRTGLSDEEVVELQRAAQTAREVKEATEMENRRLLQEITHLRVAAVATAKELDVWRHTCSVLRTKLQVPLFHCTHPPPTHPLPPHSPFSARLADLSSFLVLCHLPPYPTLPY